MRVLGLLDIRYHYEYSARCVILCWILVDILDVAALLAKIMDYWPKSWIIGQNHGLLAKIMDYWPKSWISAIFRINLNQKQQLTAYRVS
jgi:hypothetical protein